VGEYRRLACSQSLTNRWNSLGIANRGEAAVCVYAKTVHHTQSPVANIEELAIVAQCRVGRSASGHQSALRLKTSNRPLGPVRSCSDRLRPD
jgi:hypothetical protein